MSTWMIGKGLMKQHYREKKFYSNLNMGDVTDADDIHSKRVCKDFEIRNLGECDDLYLKSDNITFGWFF